MTASSRLFSWRRWLGFAIGAVLLILAVAGGLLGMYVAGSPEGLSIWLDSHFTAFFVWRVLLYTGMALFWLRLRPHALKREPQARDRIRRLEWTALVLFIASELTQWLSRG
ncbi:hypothetical protein ACM7HV_26875 [Pseudomonas paraeruginosa]|uniref:Uncharacterized protein n=1 Tax=Pseudomonas aeruginosa TaxID=287 RepID=A0ABD7JXL9_PSEAI|nr:MULTISPECIES: hypothetical protein [Pseudomonas aeruginosa group]KFF32170.1 hypothetical protein G039_0331460 [Pseudomonas aeruginosa VRFPA01]KFF33010.1 hypothetical protein G039_0326830 [Pseudomonas aeruginosa VRFPA01]RTR93286.1 hypothetical protein DY932_24215 [Pseudomonas paraeruginosa]RTS42292.1 hypothetical protein DY940_23805 [Pseudomonas aeruginosa]